MKTRYFSTFYTFLERSAENEQEMRSCLSIDVQVQGLGLQQSSTNP
jgi:hypothetical protein